MSHLSKWKKKKRDVTNSCHSEKSSKKLLTMKKVRNSVDMKEVRFYMGQIILIETNC